ncbi:amidase-7 [Coleophoma crateriformis]|uniref:amidase n=1 Tax=Coleophoma crateriformis TaxID=565419 RepID=A0A3D8SMC2_9HELO|nr:amidase-7 [Coleophoma crateriformis]
MAVTTASGATWQEVAADRQKHRDATIAAVEPALPEISEIPTNTTPIAKKVLTADEIKITESTVEVLAVQLEKGEISAVEVTKAFLRRAGLAQKVTNCITELLPERALQRAKELDEFLKTNGKPVGPLHGIPISVKEHVMMKGLDINAGFISWVGRIGEDDAHILKILWAAGCVFYARTTQPQSLMHLETSNSLYGTTVNPFNRNLTCGGSSGGEGALIGFRGSCLGIGTDIGGSIRSPAANNGLYGMKPTTLRLPTAGWSATMAGSEQIPATIGPLSTSLAGCKLFIKTLIDAKPWLKEPTLLPFEWKEADPFPAGGKKLKIGVLWDDGVVKPHPPVTRAMKELVEKLKKSGNVEIVDWKPYKHDEAWEIIANLYFSDGASQESAAINASSEPWMTLTKHIITENPHVQTHTVESLWAATARRDSYRAEYAAHWNSTSAAGSSANGYTLTDSDMVDIILCPCGPSAAPRLETAKWWGYTSQWNLLDYPALIFPVDQVSVEKDAEGEKEKYEPRNEKDAYNWKLWEEFGAEGWVDAPISLQLVGRRYEDEKVMRAAEIVEKEAGTPFVKYV